MVKSLRKETPGHDKRIKQKKDLAFKESQRGALDRFVVKLPPTIVPNLTENENVVPNLDRDEICNDLELTQNVHEEVPNIVVNENENISDREDICRDDIECEPPLSPPRVHVDIYDPRYWGSLDTNSRDLLVEKGPLRDPNIKKGPKDKRSRYFSSTCFTRILPNGEEYDRKWLVYSKELDKVFCFCCKLFKNSSRICGLSNEGLKINDTIDKHLQRHINEDREHWKQVLKRIISVVKYLSIHNLAFRGTNEKVYEISNGNFLGLIEMIAEWDPVMKEHMRRIKNNEIQYNYLSSKIQNELIDLLASKIKSAIIQKIKAAQYFSILLDCTPDASHQEQMSLIIRCVDTSESPIKIQEYFMRFLKVVDTTAQGLFDVLKSVLKDLDLDINNIRGQGYDNGANMSGCKNGVQKKLLDVNPRAMYTPCGAHCLNLTPLDMARSCKGATDFFETLNQIYKIFSASTKRWDIFKEYVKGYTVKPLSDTRWESHIESVKAVRFQIFDIRKVLLKVGDNGDDKDTAAKFKAKNLAKHSVGNFEFLLSMVIWYDLLNAVNLVSKSLQFKDMLIDDAMRQVKGLLKYFQNYRDKEFGKALTTAKDIANQLGVEADFHVGRIIHRTQFFDEIGNCEETVQSAEESFRTKFFLQIVDQAISSLERRFEQYKACDDIFGFLFSSDTLNSMDDDQLKARCDNLEAALRHEEVSDIDANDLFGELKVLRELLPMEITTAAGIFNFIKRQDSFPITSIAYRVLLTIPVTVASAERSFSKLNILKSFLRTTMAQERLNGLAMISIEHSLLDDVDIDSLIDDFAAVNSRRLNFR
ncbi:zinc finger MYM-type protein 1-like [Papaver somniferum]|uniref:zinc finger MYM-type protein 1-like n=1 Tax=Papaver somniferum TaxID=3469 RepID=UPI000E70018B|nr:zinc finger MYM-type protein 1-like [Papaver somniferum]